MICLIRLIVNKDSMKNLKKCTLKKNRKSVCKNKIFLKKLIIIKK